MDYLSIYSIENGIYKEAIKDYVANNYSGKSISCGRGAN